MHEWCEKAPFNSSRVKIFRCKGVDKEHSKLTIKMAKISNNADSILTTLHLATVQPEFAVASSLDSNQSTPK